MSENLSVSLGLDTETLSKIIEVLKKFKNIETAIVYGSRAKGNYRPGSDIDLFLNGRNLDNDTLSQVDEQLDDLFLPYKLDISSKKSISNQDLLDHISRVGKVLYQR